MDQMMFEGFPKIARWSRDVVITEKIDGTNAAIVITESEIYAQSRNRIITPDDDNYGFARWVQNNKQELIASLGEGRHFGEWYGQGIQRGYGMKQKMFALFNTERWKYEKLPEGVTTVPELYNGPNEPNMVESAMELLREYGSFAAEGFKKPEGIVIYHKAARTMFKKTFEKDDTGKEG